MHSAPSFSFLLPLAAALCWPGAAVLAAPKEPAGGGFIDRVQSVDINKQSELGNKVFARPSTLGSKEFHGGDYTGIKPAGIEKTFETPSFLGIKIPWFASKKSATKEFSGAGKEAATGESSLEGRNFETSPYFASEKASSLDGRAFETRQSPMRGASQERIEALQKANPQRQLTVEEVREILNKN